MWDPVWPGLTRGMEVVRVDLRGFGDSVTRPEPGWSHLADVLAMLEALGIGRAHLVGASLGAGVAVEAALGEPGLVASLLLVAPGGSLITRMTEDLRAFVEAEDAALERGDLDAAAAVNVAWWLVGPSRAPDAVPPEVRDLVHAMQRRAFEVTDGWEEIEEAEPDPPASERLGEVTAPTMVLTGGLDLDAVAEAAEGVLAGVPGARRTHWDDVAHLPSLERPDRFVALVEDWLRSVS
jgi:3-oxoadipate enol-lactonase